MRCQICEFETWKSLQSHINNIHGLKNKDYLERYPGAIIYSDDYRSHLKQVNANRDPSYKKVISEKIKCAWSDPEKREIYCNSLKLAQNRPEVVEKRRASIFRYIQNRSVSQKEFIRMRSIESWMDPDIRGKRIKAIRDVNSLDSTRIKHSMAIKKYYASLNSVERQSIRDKLKEVWARPENRKKILELSKVGIKIALSPEGRINFLRAQRDPGLRKLRGETAKKNLLIMLRSRVGSSLNKFLKEKLVANGLYPESEYPIGPFLVDFCFPEKRVVVEADGDWWHANPEYMKMRGSYKLHSMQEKVVCKDKKEKLYLEHRGWKLLRFWEHCIYNNIDQCILNIKGALCQ